MSPERDLNGLTHTAREIVLPASSIQVAPMPDEVPANPNEPSLKPASENPWYVLMTVAGEQPVCDPTAGHVHHDEWLNSRNRRYFNGWMAQSLREESRSELIRKGWATAADLAPLTQAERAAIAEAVANRCPDAAPIQPDYSRCLLQSVEFTRVLVCSGFVFPKGINFNQARFCCGADLTSAVFLGDSLFRKAIFQQQICMIDVKFSGDADFIDAFLEDANFRNANFAAVADFRDTIFNKGANFYNAVVSGDAQFRGANFHGDADLIGTEFNSGAFFVWAIFSDNVYFWKARFSKGVQFSNATFFKTADFGECEIVGPINLSSLTCRQSPPLFMNAQIGGEMDVNGVTWPPKPTTRDDAIRHRRAYQRLRQIMNESQRFVEEGLFLRKELECREVEEPNVAASIASRLFRWSSDYGWSITKPFAGLVANVLLGWAAIFGAEWNEHERAIAAGATAEPLGLGQSFTLSLFNVFGFLGLGRTFLDEEIQTLTTVSQVVSITQTIFGLILFFLLGLALRNRLKMQ